MDVCITRRVNIASSETLIKPIDILLKMNLTECTRAERPQATFTLSIAGITADEMNYICEVFTESSHPLDTGSSHLNNSGTPQTA